MNSITLFKVSSKGKLDPMELSTKSLHNRRALLLIDKPKKVIWLIVGKGVPKTTQKASEKAAKKINSEEGFQFDIKFSKPNDHEAIIMQSLGKEPKPEIAPAKKKTKRKKSRKTKAKIPKVPPISASQSLGHQLRGDIEEEGPEISEFQIAYYSDQDPKGTKNHRVAFKLSIELLNDIFNILEDDVPRSVANNKLQIAVTRILGTIYS
jgi:hypothetical protein